MKKRLVGLIVVALLGGNGLAQTPEEAQQAEAYYHFSRAMALEGGGQWEAALEEYEKVLAIDPTNSMIYSEMAAAYFRRRQVDQAIDYAERAIRADTDNLEAHQLLSTIYSNMLGQATSRGVPPEIIDNAIEEFEHIVRLDPNERDAYLMLGRLYRFKNDPDRATEVYRDFLEIAPGSEEGAISLAELQIDAGNVEEAVEILKKFNEEQPGSQTALTTLGDAYAQLEDFDGAADAYSGALLLDENNIDLMRALAQALFFADRFDEAIGRYQRLIVEDPEDALAYLRIGQIYRERMKYDEAREHVEKAAQLVPDSTEIRFNLALLNRDSGRFEEALSEVRELLRQTEQPRYTDAERGNRRVFLTHVAILNSMMERFDGAIEAFNEIKKIERNPDGTVDSYIVDMYRSADQVDRALAHSHTALEDYPENRQLLIQNADLIALEGRVEEGIAALREMTSDDEEDLQIYSSMINIYQREKDFEAAQDVLDDAMERFADDEQGHFLQGAIFERQRSYEEAEAAFRKALEIEADDPAVLNYLGYMLADNDVKLEEALEMIQKAVEADPINGAYLDSLGWVYYRLDRMDLAEQYLKRALLFAGRDPTIHEHMGDLYLKTGRIDEAREEYEKSIELAEDKEESDKVQKKLDDLGSGNNPN